MNRAFPRVVSLLAGSLRRAAIGATRLPAVALVILLGAGCTPRPVVSTSPTRVQDTRRDADELTLALDSLRKLAEGGEAQPHDRAVFYLNQWISSDQRATGEWAPDRLLETLPRALRITPGLETLDKLQFTAEDVPYLQQTLWLHDVAQRVRREPAPANLADWLQQMETRVGLPESEQLAAAERMFDWTVRNIQLDPLPPRPRAAVATAGSAADQAPPAALGEVGPGYAHLPMQVLLYGHGDAHERARIFIQLCRQADVEVVMLGLPESASANIQPWLPAAFIGGELYLFDTMLGLPIPGPGGEGIATLAQAVDDPELLRQLDLPDNPYPIGEQSFQQGVVALFDAEPSSLTRRMQLLQAALPAARRLALATRPSELEQRLRQSKPISQGSLWRVPFEALLYQMGRLHKIQGDPEAMIALQQESMVFAFGTPLVQGRNLHLQGRFENEEQEPGARSLYLEARVPDAELDVIQRSQYVREKVGLQQQLPENPEHQARAIEGITDMMRQRKQNATYWMGLTYYEAANYKAAVEWLAERTLKPVPPSPWTPGARYNLARCYEQIGQTNLARRWLESDTDSPQRHGNLLRAQWLADGVSPASAAAPNPALSASPMVETARPAEETHNPDEEPSNPEQADE